jgi:hypothetical protein
MVKRALVLQLLVCLSFELRPKPKRAPPTTALGVGRRVAGYELRPSSYAKLELQQTFLQGLDLRQYMLA